MPIYSDHLNVNNYSIFNLQQSEDPSSAVRRDFVTDQVAALEARLMATIESCTTSTNYKNLKSPCEIALTSHFNIGAGGLPGVGGLPPLQGVILSANSRVLLTSQQNPAENGPYVARSGTWVRAFDSNDPADFTFGFTVEVLGGDAPNKGFWMLTTPDPIVLDQTPLTFKKQERGVIDFSGGGVGGNTPEAVRKYLGAAEEIIFSPLGDGVTTVFTVTHGLNNRFVQKPSIIHLAEGLNRYMEPSIRVLDENKVEVTFGRPPATNSIAITIVGLRH
jgi:hypothetical protein